MANNRVQTFRALTSRFAYGDAFYDPIEQTWTLSDHTKCSWYLREYLDAPPSQAVLAALEMAAPANLYILAREYPHAADTDPTKIAYTRNDADGERDRQTVTTAAKYLTRHFPSLQPHQIRDLTATLGQTGFHFWDTPDLIIKAVQDGPRSCMQWDDDMVRSRGVHPYAVYSPDLGWRMAVRLEGTTIMGRCLVNTSDDGAIFVRSYKRDPEGGYSHSDTALEAWLTQQGITKANGWGGRYIKRVENRHGDPIAPYLDGGAREVVAEGNTWCIVDFDGEYRCDNTDGSLDDLNGADCEDCGDRFDEEDGTYVGYHADRHVCSSCIDNYRYVIGRRGNEYYVPEDEAVETVEGNWYHNDYLSDNNIVELANGDYADLDNCVDVDGDWYLADDDDIVFLEDSRCYALRDEGCWQCTESGDWYSDSEDYVEIDGEKYHSNSTAARNHDLEEQGQQQLDL